MVSPILTRIYSPEAYGYFAVINAVAMNFTSLSCFSFDSALVIVKTESKFYNLFAACISFIIISSIILLIILYLLKYFAGISESLGVIITLDNRNIFLIYFVSIAYAVTQIQPKWNVRRKQFKYAASVGIISQLLNRISALSIGFVNLFPMYGLIIGEFLGKIIATILTLKKNLFSERRQISKAISIKRILKVLNEYKAYPKFILPSRYLEVLVNQVPVFAFSLYFNSQALGYYALASSMLNLPIQLLSNALSPLILKQLNDYNDINKVQIFVRRITKILIIIGLPFFISLIFLADIIFPFVFGEGWQTAGLICSIIAGYGIFSLLKIFVAPLFQIYNKERNTLLLNIIQLFLVTAGLIPGILMNNYVIMISGAAFVTYVVFWIQLHVAFRIIKLNLIKWFLTLSGIYIICYIVKFITSLHDF